MKQIRREILDDALNRFGVFKEFVRQKDFEKLTDLLGDEYYLGVVSTSEYTLCSHVIIKKDKDGIEKYYRVSDDYCGRGRRKKPKLIEGIKYASQNKKDIDSDEE